MTRVEKISDLNINDTILINTVVLVDSVEMTLDYVEDYEDQRSSIRKLIFDRCSKVEFKINPGYDSPNSLLEAIEVPSLEGRCIRIETNTTAGTIEIACEEVYLSEPQPN